MINFSFSGTTRVLCPQDSLGKNTEVGCHFPSPYQIESGRYLTLGWSFGKLPASFSIPRGKALLGTTVHQGISASSLSGSVPGIWEAKPRQPLPLLQEILVQGVWRADTRGDVRGFLMVALRGQGNWRWEGPLGTPLGLVHWKRASSPFEAGTAGYL